MTGLYYYGARYYDPEVGIFLTVDPLLHEFPSWTPSHYCENNPIIYIDPDGKKKIKFEYGGFITTGVIGLSARFWKTPIGGTYDLGSTSTGGTVFIEFDDETGELKVGFNASQDKGKEKSYSFGFCFWGYKNLEKETVGREGSLTEDGHNLEGDMKLIVEDFKEKGGSIGPFGSTEKTVNGKTSEEYAIEVGYESNVGFGLFGWNLKSKITVTEDVENE